VLKLFPKLVPHFHNGVKWFKCLLTDVRELTLSQYDLAEHQDKKLHFRSGHSEE
jgi:hypothetical protein